MTAASCTRYDRRDEIATITFDRDEKRNAFSHAMAEEVLAHLETAIEQNCRVVILRANPRAKVWCAGHDLADLDPDEDTTRSSDPMLALFARIQELPIPIITMVEGEVYAGGLILNVVADLAIAARGSFVAMTANRIGIPFTPEMYSYWLRVFGMHKIKELFFTANPIAVEETGDLFNRVVEPNDLETTTYAMARAIVACSSDGIANTKLQLNRIAHRSSLTTEDHDAIESHRREILDGPDLRRRLDDLRSRLRDRRSTD